MRKYEWGFTISKRRLAVIAAVLHFVIAPAAAFLIVQVLFGQIVFSLASGLITLLIGAPTDLFRIPPRQ